MDDAIIDRLDLDMRRRNLSVDETGTILPLTTIHNTVTYMLSDEPSSLPYLLEVRPSLEFNYEGAKNKLVNLNLSPNGGPDIHFIVPGDVLADDDGGTRRQEHLLRLASWIDIESCLTVCLSVALHSHCGVTDHRRLAVLVL